MTERVIVVLEDTQSRVDWLRRVVEPFGFTVSHAATVKRFLWLMRLWGESVVAVVLDHDLGGYSVPISLQDADGLDGMDACAHVPIGAWRALVWSSNHVEAPRMEALLRERGAREVVRASWGDAHEVVESTVQRWTTTIGPSDVRLDVSDKSG